MAVVFDDALGLGASQTVLFDPSGGLEDLQKGVIRPVSYKNIEDDPVRILRGFRIAQQLDFDIEGDFERWVKKNHDIIKKSPSERVRDEILRIFEGKNTKDILEKLVSVKVLGSIIPHVKQMVRMGKTGQMHKFTLIQHSLKTVGYMEEFLKKKS